MVFLESVLLGACRFSVGFCVNSRNGGAFGVRFSSHSYVLKIALANLCRVPSDGGLVKILGWVDGREMSIIESLTKTPRGAY